MPPFCEFCESSHPDWQPHRATPKTSALADVRSADQAWRDAKSAALALARVEALATPPVVNALKARDEAVRAAHDAGLPNYMIGEDGLLTTNTVAVQESLARTETTREGASA